MKTMRTFVGAALVATSLAACAGSGVAGAKATPKRPIHDALTTCMKDMVIGGIEGDAGHSANMSTKGDNEMTITQIACVLQTLDVPDATVASIDKTTAMMGV